VINSLKDTSTDALLHELSLIQAGHADGIRRASAILCELRDRKKFHPAMNTSILRWFAEIHAEKLHPEFVIMFSGLRPVIKAAISAPLADQAIWAKGGSITIAEINAAREVVEVAKPIIRMTKRDLSVAFGPDGVRPITEQVEIARKELGPVPAKAKAVAKFHADPITRTITLRGEVFQVDELRAALADLGLAIVKRELAGMAAE
jgi:hypothetical protein